MRKRRLGRVGMLGVLITILGLLSSSLSASGTEIEEAQASLIRATERYEQAHGSLHQLENKLDSLIRREATATAELEKLQARLQRTAVANYRRSPALTLVNSRDLTRQMRADALIRSVRGDQADVIDTTRKAQERLSRLRGQLEEAEAEQRENIDQLNQSRADIEAGLEALKAAEVLRLEAEREERRRQASEAASAAARAEAAREAAVIERRLEFEPGDPKGDEPIASGRDFVCPVQGPHNFIDSWGFPRSSGRRHKGVDMMAAHGTLVVAPVDGNVEFRSNSIGGQSFHLAGDNGNYYYGTHLQGYEGDNRWVQAGTVIGYVGSSGNASADAPHLHFEIHPGHGSATNPFPTTSQYCEGG